MKGRKNAMKVLDLRCGAKRRMPFGIMMKLGQDTIWSLPGMIFCRMEKLIKVDLTKLKIPSQQNTGSFAEMGISLYKHILESIITSFPF